MQIIDSHQHFWIYDPKTMGWISDDMKVIQQDFTPEQLKNIFIANQIEGSITVQVEQTEEETHLLIEEAKQNDFIKGVVGWIDLNDEAIEEKLQHLSSYKNHLKGFRHILQAEQNDFMLAPSFIHGLHQLEKYGFTYDIVIKHHQLPNAIQLVKQVPQTLSIILDHIGKPDIKNKEIQNWANDLKSLSKFSNVYCKISGMVAEADWHHWKEEEMYSYLDIVMDSFGVERVMFGSDWPVCLIASSYERWLETIQKYMQRYSQEDQQKIFADNCKKFYHI
jgi:L-fuconolactonase